METSAVNPLHPTANPTVRPRSYSIKFASLQFTLKEYFATICDHPDKAQREILLEYLEARFPVQLKACRLTDSRLRKWFANQRQYTRTRKA